MPQLASYSAEIHLTESTPITRWIAASHQSRCCPHTEWTSMAETTGGCWAHHATPDRFCPPEDQDGSHAHHNRCGVHADSHPSLDTIVLGRHGDAGTTLYPRGSHRHQNRTRHSSSRCVMCELRHRYHRPCINPRSTPLRSIHGSHTLPKTFHIPTPPPFRTPFPARGRNWSIHCGMSAPRAHAHQSA